jgi:hypothetical protein
MNRLLLEPLFLLKRLFQARTSRFRKQFIPGLRFQALSVALKEGCDTVWTEADRSCTRKHFNFNCTFEDPSLVERTFGVQRDLPIERGCFAERSRGALIFKAVAKVLYSECYGAEHPRGGFYALGILVCI